MWLINQMSHATPPARDRSLRGQPGRRGGCSSRRLLTALPNPSPVRY
jgi:hypothetical protein